MAGRILAGRLPLEIENAIETKSIRTIADMPMKRSGIFVVALIDSATKKGLASNADHRPAHCFQHLHDIRLVRTSEVSKRSAIQSHFGELADRLLRILLPGPRKPN